MRCMILDWMPNWTLELKKEKKTILGQPTKIWPVHLCSCLVAQSCPTLCDPMDCSQPGSSYGISQAWILEWCTIFISRREYWSGLPLPSPMHENEKWSEVNQSCLTLRDPMGCSLPGSSVLGISQARVLEWGAIAFSGMSVYSLSKMRLQVW